MANKHNIYYISEIVLNSELVLFNNAKLLKKDKSLYNNKHIDRITNLREEYTLLDYSNESGLQSEKKVIRDEIRLLSSKTFIDRDPDIFGDMLLLVINKVATSNRFNGYSYIDEMKSLSIQHILLYTWKFDPFRQSLITNQYSSAFAYLSTIIHNAFIATINTHKKEEKKAKEEFVETQKLFHRDHNASTIGEDYSVHGTEIYINNITDTLIDEIKKIDIHDETIIFYNKDYRISIFEYNEISEYFKDLNYPVSIQRIRDVS